MNIHPPRLALRTCMILAGIAGLAMSTTDASAQSEHRPRLVTADPASDEWESHGDNVADKHKPRLVRYVVGDPPDDDPGEDDDPDDPDDPGGFEWTVLTPSQDSRMIYVSASRGNDASDGSRDAPVRTIRHARDLVREGHPDWILLRRGDTFREGIAWWKSGRSQEEPLVITNYGDSSAARPIIAPPLQDAGFNSSHDTTSHLAFVGLHFRAPSDGTGKGGIVILNRAGGDILIEDCRIEGFRDGIILQRGSNMRVRGNVVIDSAAPFGGHSQGLSAWGNEGLTVEGNVFDHNGWREDGTAPPTIFNHNIYIGGKEDDGWILSDVTIINNVLARGSSFGIKVAAKDPASIQGLRIENNLLMSNGNGMQLGDRVEYGITDLIVSNNVLADMGRTINGIEQSYGIIFETGDEALLDGNFFIDKEFGGSTFAINIFPYTTGRIRNARVVNNISYDWRWGSLEVDSARIENSVVQDNVIIDFGDPWRLTRLSNHSPANVEFIGNAYFGGTDRFQNLFEFSGERLDFPSWKTSAHELGAIDASSLSFSDPLRTVDNYMDSLGHEGSKDAYLSALRSMKKGDWDPELMPAAFNQYIAEGFDR